METSLLPELIARSNSLFPNGDMLTPKSGYAFKESRIIRESSLTFFSHQEPHSEFLLQCQSQ
jgi:hypothetical protein